MKLPENAPDWHEILAKIPKDKLPALFGRADVQKALQKTCEERYPYWDEFKYYPHPSDVPVEWLWTRREMGTLGSRIFVPLKDLGGRNFSFWLPDKAQELLHFIDQRTSGPVLSDGELFHSRERYIARSLTEEAIASSQIEGAATTRDAAKSMLLSGRKPSNKSERMIANNLRAIEKIREIKDRPLSRDLLIELQRILTEDTLDDPADGGRFRRSPEDDNVRVLDVDGVSLHDPPRGKDLDERLEQLIAFANTESSAPFIHPVVKAIVLHFWIGFDHPFVDGSGRTARAIFYWYLLKKNYWLFEFISISQIVHRSFGQYKRAYIYSEKPGGDLTYFLMYNLRVVRTAINGMLRYIEQKGQELRRANELLRKIPALNHRQRELLLHVLKKPGRQYTFRSHQAVHQVAYQTARTDLLELAALGYLEEIKSGKMFFFLATPKVHELLELA